MGRLIDADKLLEETRRDRDYARKNGFLDMYYERQVLIDRIKAQPTAYDLDDVVEQIKILSPANYVTKDDVLKIVKGGGVYAGSIREDY